MADYSDVKAATLRMCGITPEDIDELAAEIAVKLMPISNRSGDPKRSMPLFIAALECYFAGVLAAAKKTTLREIHEMLRGEMNDE